MRNNDCEYGSCNATPTSTSRTMTPNSNSNSSSNNCILKEETNPLLSSPPPSSSLSSSSSLSTTASTSSTLFQKNDDDIIHHHHQHQHQHRRRLLIGRIFTAISCGIVMMFVIGSHSGILAFSNDDGSSFLDFAFGERVSLGRRSGVYSHSFRYNSPPERLGSSFQGAAEAAAAANADHNDDDEVPEEPQVLTHWDIPTVQKRCDFVISRFHERDVGMSQQDLAERYHVQSGDVNLFYRANAIIFWRDFVDGHWGEGLVLTIRDEAELLEGDRQVDPLSTWTWVTGDQHLSNFGAWRNRHGDVVFGVNDFDEAAIYDFQIDILRIAVSILNHAVTNKLSTGEVTDALKHFTKSYVKTVVNYVGNEEAALFELTRKSTTGKLKDFLEDVEEDKSALRQLRKFTFKDPKTGERSFIKGKNGLPHPDTRLAEVSPARVEEFKAQFTSTLYGATLMQLGWAVRQWDDDFFSIEDVAARIGSGVGSFGVDRFYVLLKGTDGLLDDGVDGTAVVLDVKYQPVGAVWHVLTPHQRAWYSNIFPNSAARTIEAQRRLTSYTDPYTGWIELIDDEGILRPFSVRQRSPWKDSFDELDLLTDPEDFNDYMEQIAIATATSHVRGSVAKKPGDFKTIIKALLGKKKNRKVWTKTLTELAFAYHEQVLLDYECFREYVETYFPKGNDNRDNEDDDI